MADGKEKPAHVQVAEAGFGAAIEAKGFRQVGRTHWRLDGDGIVHHIRLNKGYSNIPGSFRDAYGIVFPEFDALAARCNCQEDGDKLPGTSIMCHRARADAFAPMDLGVQHTEWERLYGSEDDRSFWLLLKDIFKPPPSFYSEFYKRPLGYKVNLDGGGRYDAVAWVLQDITPEELARSLTDCWENGYWQTEGRHTSFQSVYESLFRKRVENRTDFLESHLIYAYMGGDLHLIQRMADREIDALKPTLEEHHERIYQNCVRPVSRVDWTVERDTPAGWRAIRDSAMASFAYPRRHLLRIKEMCAALGIPVQAPDVDPGPVQAWDRRIEERVAGIDYDPRLHPH